MTDALLALGTTLTFGSFVCMIAEDVGGAGAFSFIAWDSAAVQGPCPVLVRNSHRVCGTALLREAVINLRRLPWFARTDDSCSGSVRGTYWQS